MLDTININAIICSGVASREQSTAETTLQTTKKEPEEFLPSASTAMTGNYSSTN